MENKFVCTFKDQKQHTADFVNNLSAIKRCRRLSIIFMPIACACVFYSFYNNVEALIPFSIFYLFLVILIFLYPYFMRSILDKNTKMKYGDSPVTNKIIFDDRIYIETEEDRIVLDYCKVKKIVDCYSIYLLEYGKHNGTYFAKHSCPAANDEQILVFLQKKTGAKLVTKNSPTSTIVLSVISFALSALLVIATLLGGMIYTKQGVDLLDNPKYITLSDTGMDHTVEYADIYYQVHICELLFYSEGSTLIFDYTAENYKKELEYINSNFEFLQAPVKDEMGDILISENEFGIGDWCFKVCRDETDSNYAFPKYFRIIGYNDKTLQVAFLDFDSVDLDLIDMPMQEFVESNFDYDFQLKS